MSNNGQSSDSDLSDDDRRSASDQSPSVVDPQAEMCEVCLIQPRDAQHVKFIEISKLCVFNGTVLRVFACSRSLRRIFYFCNYINHTRSP